MEKLLKTLLFRVAAVAAVVCFLGVERANAQAQCGTKAPQDLIFLLDLSGSQTQSSIAAQKAAAREFLLSFNHPTQKPKVGIVTFNSDCDCGELEGFPSYDLCNLQGEVNCYTVGFDHARVVVPLSTNYTSHLAQLAPGSGILGQGAGGAGIGGSNMKAALNLAQQHLVAQGSGWNNNIVLLSDGEPNMPGYFLYPLENCNNCDCDPAELEAEVAASNVKSAGTKIYTGFVGDSCGSGNSFLQNHICSSPPASHHFPNPDACFDAVFSQLASYVGCSDGQSCTIDQCNEETGYCLFTPTDSDGDGINDCIDTCVGNNNWIGNPCDGTDPDNCNGGVYSCSTGVLLCTDNPQVDDSDGDGVWNCVDNCIGNNALIGQACDGGDPDNCNGGVYSCSTGTLLCNDNPQVDDSDGDGIWNCVDTCVGNNALIGQPCDGSDPDSCNGGSYSCSTGVLLCSDDLPLDDSDGDGVANCVDGCPSDSGKSTPGVCGCGVSDADTDGDGTPNCNDGCASDSNKTQAGICGCGVADVDLDGDGQIDCVDQCPNDPNKGAPGLCGCGLPDTDSDADGNPDCFDNCDTDSTKLEPGICGCGTADSDTNSNGITDCLEQGTTVTVQCTQIDVLGYVEALENVVVGQDAQLDRLLRDLRIKREICPDQEAVMALVNSTTKKSTKLLKQNVSQLEVLPAAALECEESVSCTAVPLAVDEASYLKRSKSLRIMTIRAIDLAGSCRSGPGVCEGTVEGCRERVILRKEQIAKEKRLAKRWHRRNTLNIQGIPRTTDKCV